MNATGSSFAHKLLLTIGKIMFVLAVIVVLGVLLIAVCSLVDKVDGYPKIIDVVTITSVVSAKEQAERPEGEFGEYSARLYLLGGPLRGMDIARTPAPLWATSEVASGITIGRTYELVVEKWSNGWGPFYVLRSYHPVGE